MDLWSNPNLSPFMAVTAHWIETKLKDTPAGPQYDLHLHADLIGFHQVLGNHNGEHLMQAFLYVLNHISITSKVSNKYLWVDIYIGIQVFWQIGWIKLDNTSNNDTFMASLERELNARGIPFKRVGNRIRYDIIFITT